MSDQFDITRALRYRKKGTVLAVKSDCPITYYKPWAGERGQTLPAGHMVMHRMEQLPNGQWKMTDDVYGCAREEFEQTYEQEQEFNLLGIFYRKKTTVLAYRPDPGFKLVTVTGDGNVEVETEVGPEVYLVKNDTVAGEVYPVPVETFESLYSPVLEHLEP